MRPTFSWLWRLGLRWTSLKTSNSLQLNWTWVNSFDERFNILQVTAVQLRQLFLRCLDGLWYVKKTTSKKQNPETDTQVILFRSGPRFQVNLIFMAIALAVPIDHPSAASWRRCWPSGPSSGRCTCIRGASSGMAWHCGGAPREGKDGIDGAKMEWYIYIYRWIRFFQILSRGYENESNWYGIMIREDLMIVAISALYIRRL